MSASFDIVAEDFPPDLTRGVAAEAERDADQVGRYLANLGLTGTPDRPLRLPSKFLLSLGAGLRLSGWEQNGFAVHRDVGLPAANDVILDAFRSVTEPDRNVPSLLAEVLRVWVERFCWSGREEFDADVMVDVINPDAVIEGLAEFLWAARGWSPAETSTGTIED